jgi:hypothetical protein
MLKLNLALDDLNPMHWSQYASRRAVASMSCARLASAASPSKSVDAAWTVARKSQSRAGALSRRFMEETT